MTGLDIEPGMLAAAREKDEAQQVQWVEGYLNQRRSEIPFDLIISPCGSPGHMLEIAQQLECWRMVHHNLTVEGRFVLSEPMAPCSKAIFLMQQ